MVSQNLEIMLHAVVENTSFGGGSDAYQGKCGFEAFTHHRPAVPVPGWFECLCSFRYPPYHKKHMSKVDVKNPSLTRGETLEDQKVGISTATTVSKLLATSAKWATVAVNFAMVNARIEMLRSAIGGLPNGSTVRGQLSNKRCSWEC